MKQDAQEVKQKNEKLQNLKKSGIGLTSLLFFIGTSILASSENYRHKISLAVSKIVEQTKIIANLFMEGTIKPILRWLQESNLLTIIGNAFADTWDRIGDGLLWCFKKINSGFDFLLNADNDYYKTNIFHFIFTQLLSKIANKVVTENTVFTILEFFGIKYQANITFFPNLNQYIKYGPKTMKQIKNVSELAQQTSEKKGAGFAIIQYRPNFTRTESKGYGQAIAGGMRSNWVAWGKVRDKRIDEDRTVLKYADSGSDWTTFSTSINELWKYVIEQTPKVYNISVRNISQTGKSFPNPFEGSFGSIWGGIKNYWGKLREYELPTVGGGTIKAYMLFSPYSLKLVEHFDTLFQQVNKYSYLMPWWSSMKSQHDYLMKCYRNTNPGNLTNLVGQHYNRYFDYNEATGWFGMGDYAKTLYLSSVLVIIKNRIEREQAMSQQSMKQINLIKNKDEKYVVYKGMLYKQYDSIKLLLDNLETPIQSKNKELSTGAVNPQQYFDWLKTIFMWKMSNDDYGWAFIKTFRQLKIGKMYDFEFINEILRKIIIKIGQYNQKRHFRFYGGNVQIGFYNNGYRTYYTLLNGKYNVQTFDNLNDMEVLTDEQIRKEGYVSRNILSGRLIQLYVQTEAMIARLYQDRHQLLIYFQQNVKALKNK